MSIHAGTVIQAYRPPEREPLIGPAGTLLTVEQPDTDFPGWRWCVNTLGIAGWVPERLLERSGKVASLREDYDGTELDVTTGQRLSVLSEEGGWLWCRTLEGNHGWVPASHVAVQGKRLTEEFTKPSIDLDALIRDHKRAEEALRESEAKYRILVEHSLQGLIIAQGWPARLVFVNRSLAQFLGREEVALLALPPEEVRELVHEEDQEAFFEDYRALLAGLAAPQRRAFRVRRPDGSPRWVEAYISVTRMDGEPAVQAAVMDVTERLEADRERERLIAELNRALAEIRTLRGIVPICANCKKVRDDHGFWQQVETYVSAHSHAEFSHSICPDCVVTLYPDQAQRILAEVEGRSEGRSPGAEQGTAPPDHPEGSDK